MHGIHRTGKLLVKVILEADSSDSELRILDWILYQVCSNAEIKHSERLKKIK